MSEATYKTKLIARISADPDVAPALKNATEASSILGRMMKAYQYDLDPAWASKVFTRRHEIDRDPAMRKECEERVARYSNPGIAASLQNTAKRDCQSVMDTLTECAFILLERALPVARRLAEEVKSEEEKFLARFELPHSPTSALSILLGVIVTIETQLKGIEHDKAKMNLPLTPNAFSSTLGLFAP